MPPKRGRVENDRNEVTTTRERDQAGNTTTPTQSRKKVRKSDHGPPDQDQPMMDVKSEDESTTTESITHQSIIPYGLLKLPQSIASALASDFLNKREIRDLGVTCRWMLVSLNECVIREPITLQTAVRRLKRQRLSQSSTKVVAKTLALREVVSRIPNLFIGKFTTVRFSTGHCCLELPHISLLSELGHLIDTHILMLDVISANYKKAIQKKFDQILPLAVPPHLQELFIERDCRLLPLTQFQLPDTLKRIRWKSNKFSSQRSNKFSEVQWPKGLKALLNIYEPSLDGLPTEGLAMLSCDPKMTFGLPTPNLTLANSIADLDWNLSSITGRHYHDLPFPPQLKRLVLGCEITANDFNLNEWVHLPKSCENLQFTFSDSSPEFLLGPTDVSSTTRNIIIPSFVRTLRVFYPNPLHSASRQSRLCLTHATSLNALETNQVDNIDWPTAASTSPSTGLSSIKLHGLGDDLITHLTALPSTLQQLDLSEISDLDDMDLSKSGPLCQLFATVTKLRRLKVACWQDSPRICQRVMNWSRELIPKCVLEFGIQPGDTTTMAQPTSRLTFRFSAYQAGELIQPIRDRTLTEAKKWTSERERYDPQVDLE